MSSERRSSWEPSAYAVARGRGSAADGVPPQTVTRRLERPAELGVIEALDDRPRAGRAPVIAPEAKTWLVALRKRNYSVYEISQALKEQGVELSVTAVRELLAQEGFAPLPRRLDEERPARLGPTTEPIADVRSFALNPREFFTLVGGLFLFSTDLIRLDSDGLADCAKLPGSGMIPAGHALRVSLALKL